MKKAYNMSVHRDDKNKTIKIQLGKTSPEDAEKFKNVFCNVDRSFMTWTSTDGSISFKMDVKEMEENENEESNDVPLLPGFRDSSNLPGSKQRAATAIVTKPKQKPQPRTDTVSPNPVRHKITMSWNDNSRQLSASADIFEEKEPHMICFNEICFKQTYEEFICMETLVFSAEK